MISYWNILVALSLVELALAVVFIWLVASAARKPVGARLVAIGAIFTAQAVLSIVVFEWYKSSGYGASVARPLLLYHLLTIAGLTVLLDIVRR